MSKTRYEEISKYEPMSEQHITERWEEILELAIQGKNEPDKDKRVEIFLTITAIKAIITRTDLLVSKGKTDGMYTYIKKDYVRANLKLIK